MLGKNVTCMLLPIIGGSEIFFSLGSENMSQCKVALLSFLMCLASSNVVAQSTEEVLVSSGNRLVVPTSNSKKNSETVRESSVRSKQKNQSQQIAINVKLIGLSGKNLGESHGKFKLINDAIVKHSGVGPLLASGSLDPSGFPQERKKKLDSRQMPGVNIAVFEAKNHLVSFLEDSQEQQKTRVIVNANLLTGTGRTASYNATCEYRQQTQDGLTDSSVLPSYNIRADVAPIILENGRAQLEINVDVSEFASKKNSQRNTTSIAHRWGVDMGVELELGQTVIAAQPIRRRNQKHAAGHSDSRTADPHRLAQISEIVLAITPNTVNPTASPTTRR